MQLADLRRWGLVAGVAGLLAVASTAASHSSLGFDTEHDLRSHLGGGDGAEMPQQALPPASETAPPPVAPAETIALPDWVDTVVKVGCLAVVAVFAALGLWLLLREALQRARRLTPGAPTDKPVVPPTAAVVAAVDAGLADLSDSDADPRRAVIACWVRLEQVAAAAGTAREIGDTPTDLVARLLSGHAGGDRPRVSADVLSAFARIYREARYATHTVDEQMRQQARAALQRLRAELHTEVQQ